MVAEVIRALSGLREIFVISHSSTLTYANQAVDVRTVGRELGVHYIVTGVIERNSSRIRLATELSDAKSGAVMSTGRYDGAIADLFAFQDQVAMRVVADIEPRVKEWELRQTLRKRSEDLDAYDLTLRGLSLLSRLDYDAFSQARGLLQQAIVLDPDYSVPYAHAAHWHIFRVGQGWSPDPAADGVEGRRLAATAVDLDHDNAPALAILGHTNSFILRQPEVGLNYFGRALDASPNCAMAWALSSATHSYLGRGTDAVTQAEQALRLSPRDIHAFYYQTALTLAHYTSGNHEAAVASGLRAVSQNPAFCTNLRHTAASLAALGRLDEARRIADLHARAQPGFTLKRFEQNCPYQRDQAAIFLDHLRQAGFPN
jgi:adenylate cyclase